MKKFFVPVFISLMVMSGMVAAADQKAGKNVLPLDPDQYLWHFGMIPRDAQVSHHYALTNNQRDTVTIIEVISDCDCTHTPKTPIAVAPGDTYLFKVVFDTRTYVGETNRDIHIVTDYEPAPEMTVYFTSLTARLPATINILPPVSAFIAGKDSEEFLIRNIVDEKTDFKVLIDNDSLFEVSDPTFTLKGGKEKKITVRPQWDKMPSGSYYSCLVIEVTRDKTFRVSLPIKVNKF